MSPTARKQVLHRAAALVTERLAEFAATETLDMGKPITESLMLATWKIAPALAYGNTVVLKPAEQSPLTAALLAQAFADAGLPDGVLNLVQGFGPGEAGERLTEHPGVDLITFTGESATGRAVMARAAQTLKRCSFELGGKSPAIVMADADLDRAVPGTIDGLFRIQGEVCRAGSRLLVQRGIYDEFCSRYAAAAENLVVGDPRDPATRIGPMVSTEHLAKVMSYVELGHDAAIALANDSRYGLAGQIWTTNLDTAHQVARAVRGDRRPVPAPRHGAVRRPGQGRGGHLPGSLPATRPPHRPLHRPTV